MELWAHFYCQMQPFRPGTGKTQQAKMLTFHNRSKSYRFLGSEGCLEFSEFKFWKSNGLPNWNHLECEDIQQLKEDPYVKQVFHFCRVIKQEETPMIDASDGLKSLSICLQILSERKKWCEFSN